MPQYINPHFAIILSFLPCLRTVYNSHYNAQNVLLHIRGKADMGYPLGCTGAIRKNVKFHLQLGLVDCLSVLTRNSIVTLL